MILVIYYVYQYNISSKICEVMAIDHISWGGKVINKPRKYIETYMLLCFYVSSTLLLVLIFSTQSDIFIVNSK